MRLTQHKGDIAVVTAIAAFTKLGFDVSLPITESAAYDIVVDCRGVMKRVQVRFTSGREVELRRIHSNSTGYVIKKTIIDAYDWLYVLDDNQNAYLIPECLAGRRSVHTQQKYLFSTQTAML